MTQLQLIAVQCISNEVFKFKSDNKALAVV